MTTAESKRRQIRHAMITGVRWLATARLIAQASSWVITLVVIRLLTPADYGLQAMVAVIYSLILLISQTGFDRAIARCVDFGTNELRQILGFNLALSVLIMIVVWLAAPHVAAYYDEDAVVPLLRTLSVGFVISVFKIIPVGLVWRNLDYRNHALAGLIGTVSGSLTTLLLALMDYGVWALINGMLMSVSASAIYLQIRTRWLVWPTLAIARIRSLIKDAWTIGFGFFVWQLAFMLDILIGGRQLTAETLGFYAVALNLCSLPLAKVVPLANQVLYPAYAKLQKDHAAVSVYFEKSLASLSFVLFPAFLGLAAISEWLVPVVFGARWIGIEKVMMIVAFAMPFRVVMSMCNPMLNATGNAMTSLLTGVFAVIVIAIAVLVGVGWGVIGLATAVLIVTPIVMSVVIWRTRASSGVSFRSLTSKIGPILVISAVMAAVVYWVGASTTHLLPNAGVIGLQVVCGVLIYAMLAAVFARSLLLSTASIIRTSLEKRTGSWG